MSDRQTDRQIAYIWHTAKRTLL